ncbi:hypothetical protein D3C84_1245050 [compost metagenome]
MLHDKAEITVGTFLGKGIHEQQTHTLNALAHIGQLLLPNGTQCVIAENGCDNGSTVSRWV